MKINWVALAMVAGLVLTTMGSPCAAQSPAVSDFFKEADLKGAKLSPSGSRVAAIRYMDSIRRDVLVTIPMKGERVAKVLAAHGDGDIATFHWTSDDQLVYTVRDRTASAFYRQGSGLFSVAANGDGTSRMLIKTTWAPLDAYTNTAGALRAKPRDTALDPLHRFHSVVRDFKGKVLVTRENRNGDELTSTTLLRVDAESGRSEVVSQGAPDNVIEWYPDEAGAPKVATAYKDGRVITYYRKEATGPWSVLWDEAAFGTKERRFKAIGLRGAEELFVDMTEDNAEERSVLGIVSASNPSAAPKVLLSAPGFDFEGHVITAPGQRIVGVQSLTDAWGTTWFDPALKEAQTAIDEVLPSTNNVVTCGACDKSTVLLVHADSDRQPPVYYLYEMASKQLTPLSATRPWIKTADMGMRGFERIKARDGLEFPVHITTPRNAEGPSPMVVLVHGGPNIRGGYWGWNEEAQFLASRNYLVLEPEFRGSTGYGAKLTKAGFKQWGLAMQDDIADATRWAIAKGLADANRICIIGGSYGGYATLMGLIRYPDLYRCGVEYFGATDIDLLYTNGWSDMHREFKAYGMPTLIGDRVKDAKQLAETSPLKQAARLTRPLLMVHGRQDFRVPIEHGDAFFAAVKGQNRAVEYKVYQEEGHGFDLTANRIDFWTRVEVFLGKHIGSASSAMSTKQ